MLRCFLFIFYFSLALGFSSLFAQKKSINCNENDLEDLLDGRWSHRVSDVNSLGQSIATQLQLSNDFKDLNKCENITRDKKHRFNNFKERLDKGKKFLTHLNVCLSDINEEEQALKKSLEAIVCCEVKGYVNRNDPVVKGIEFSKEVLGISDDYLIWDNVKDFEKMALRFAQKESHISKLALNHSFKNIKDPQLKCEPYSGEMQPQNKEIKKRAEADFKRSKNKPKVYDSKIELVDRINKKLRKMNLIIDQINSKKTNTTLSKAQEQVSDLMKEFESIYFSMSEDIGERIIFSNYLRKNAGEFQFAGIHTFQYKSALRHEKLTELNQLKSARKTLLLQKRPTEVVDEKIEKVSEELNGKKWSNSKGYFKFTKYRLISEKDIAPAFNDLCKIIDKSIDEVNQDYNDWKYRNPDSITKFLIKNRISPLISVVLQNPDGYFPQFCTNLKQTVKMRKRQKESAEVLDTALDTISVVSAVTGSGLILSGGRAALSRYFFSLGMSSELVGLGYSGIHFIDVNSMIDKSYNDLSSVGNSYSSLLSGDLKTNLSEREKIEKDLIDDIAMLAVHSIGPKFAKTKKGKKSQLSQKEQDKLSQNEDLMKKLGVPQEDIKDYRDFIESQPINVQRELIKNKPAPISKSSSAKSELAGSENGVIQKAKGFKVRFDFNRYQKNLDKAYAKAYKIKEKELRSSGVKNEKMIREMAREQAIKTRRNYKNVVQKCNGRGEINDVYSAANNFFFAIRKPYAMASSAWAYTSNYDSIENDNFDVNAMNDLMLTGTLDQVIAKIMTNPDYSNSKKVLLRSGSIALLDVVNVLVYAYYNDVSDEDLKNQYMNLIKDPNFKSRIKKYKDFLSEYDYNFLQNNILSSSNISQDGTLKNHGQIKDFIEKNFADVLSVYKQAVYNVQNPKSLFGNLAADRYAARRVGGFAGMLAGSLLDIALLSRACTSYADGKKLKGATYLLLGAAVLPYTMKEVFYRTQKTLSE